MITATNHVNVTFVTDLGALTRHGCAFALALVCDADGARRHE